MGRGLSVLQMKILAIGAEEITNSGRQEPITTNRQGMDVETSLALVKIYGRRGKYGWEWPDGAKLNAARAAISRAFARLESRGLVVRMKMVHKKEAGVSLTPEGWRYVQEHMPAASSRPVDNVVDKTMDTMDNVG